MPQSHVSRVRHFAAFCGLMILLVGPRHANADEDGSTGARRSDATTWGSDHVGRPVPEFITGDECLFCHRDVGPSWPTNRHRLAVRRPTDSDHGVGALTRHVPARGFAEAVDFVMGHRRQTRFLKRSKEYGKLELLSLAWKPDPAPDGQLISDGTIQWDDSVFARSCAGCHCTAVDARTQAFSAVSLDCYACHGHVSFDHTKQPGLAYLSPKNKASGRVVVSICGQCHLRGGTSRSTGRPYPNNFVAGDNLLRDYELDWSADFVDQLDPGDRHVFENARDVLISGQERVTCLSCHQVHAPSTEKHQLLSDMSLCATCHPSKDDKSTVVFLGGHSKTCGY